MSQAEEFIPRLGFSIEMSLGIQYNHAYRR